MVNLSELDFEALTSRFQTQATTNRTRKAYGDCLREVRQLIKLNNSRMDYMARFQDMIDEYNAGSQNLETFCAELREFARGLTQEEQRHIAEGLSEEELAIFDILTKPEPKLTKKEEAEVKRVAKTLLQTLKWEKLVLDWRMKQQACAEVQETISEIFDMLPATYSKKLFDEKRQLAYRHIHAAYAGAGKAYTSEQLKSSERGGYRSD